MASITVMAIDSNGNPLWNQFLTDLAAVRQIIYTNLDLWASEWWEATNIGLAMWQTILSSGNNPSNQQAASLCIQQNILNSCVYVIGVSNVQTSWTPSTRAFSFSCDAMTPFGTIPITYPQPPSHAFGG
jgi:hypothetical protein